MKPITFSTLLLFSAQLFSQTITTQNALVSFYSELEDVTAINASGESDLDTLTGAILFSFPVQSFVFDNATMQKHFNEEGVMHSKKYTRAKFAGSIVDIQKIDFTKDGKYSITVEGNLTIKETTKPVKVKATIEVKNGTITATSEFNLDRFEYGVNGKDGVISQVLEIKVKAIYEKI